MNGIHEGTTREELAALVAEQLRSDQIEVVLVGGSVAAIYSSEKFVTCALDFVHWDRLPAIAKSLAPLGLEMTDRLATHPSSKLRLAFVSAPVAVGHKFITEDLLATRTTSLGSFRLLSQLDCVLDRLSAFYQHDDRQGLEQAVAIAQAQPVPLDDIRQWSRDEGQVQREKPSYFDERFAEFLRMMNAER